MTFTPTRLPPSQFLQEFRLLEQVHTALGSAHKLDDFYAIVASLLVAPDTFGFSRAFFLRYDDRQHAFSGRIALGAGTAEENAAFRSDLMAEQQLLQSQIKDIEQHSHEPAAIQHLYDLRYHGVWIQLMQGEAEGTALNNLFQNVRLERSALSPGHLLSKAATDSHASIYTEQETDFSGLDEFLKGSVSAGRLMTRRGLHGVLIADRMFEDQKLDAEALVHFQWLLSHASVTLDNVELVEELTISARHMQEMDRIKTNFLSIVSHELRTPLTSIIGFAHLLKEGKAGDVTPAQQNILQRVTQHSQHLHNMVNDLLEIAEVESGGIIDVHLQAVDPLAALMKVIPKIEPRRINKQVSIEPIVKGPIPTIRVDSSALERILYHLLDNAIKFISEEGAVRVEFSVENSRLNIAIADTGIGISQENLQRIFDHFYQVDFRLERAYGGMGIGLTVVKLLLEATGGQIRVESKPGAGSRFIVSYPATSAAAY